MESIAYVEWIWRNVFDVGGTSTGSEGIVKHLERCFRNTHSGSPHDAVSIFLVYESHMTDKTSITTFMAIVVSIISRRALIIK